MDAGQDDAHATARRARLAGHRRGRTLKGIGFTIAIFIAARAFEDDARDEATIAILVASVLAGLIGFAVLAVRHRLQSTRAPASTGP